MTFSQQEIKIEQIYIYIYRERERERDVISHIILYDYMLCAYTITVAYSSSYSSLAILLMLFEPVTYKRAEHGTFSWEWDTSVFGFLLSPY
jgi:hypothetical protein